MVSSILRSPQFEEEGVALLHLGLELTQGLGRPLDVGTDEPAGRARPGGQLDQLAVEAPQLGVRVEGGRRHHQGQGVRLPRPRLASEQQVVAGQLEDDQLVVLVVAEGDSAPQVGPGHAWSTATARAARPAGRVGPAPAGPAWQRPGPRRTRTRATPRATAKGSAIVARSVAVHRGETTMSSTAPERRGTLGHDGRGRGVVEADGAEHLAVVALEPFPAVEVDSHVPGVG